jgi:hypothetical protein
VKFLYHPLNLNAPHTKPTREWISANEEKYGIITRVVDINDYASPSHFLQDYWGKGEDILYMAWDVLPTNKMVEEMINCKYGLCAQAAYIYPVHTGLKEPVIALRNRGEDGSLMWIKKGEKFADCFNMELTKFSVWAQSRIGDVPECHWQKIDNELSKQSPIKTHVHWPEIIHNQA